MVSGSRFLETGLRISRLWLNSLVLSACFEGSELVTHIPTGPRCQSMGPATRPLIARPIALPFISGQEAATQANTRGEKRIRYGDLCPVSVIRRKYDLLSGIGCDYITLRLCNEGRLLPLTRRFDESVEEIVD